MQGRCEMGIQKLRCLTCRGQKTINGIGWGTRVKCEVCNGTGVKEHVEDPINELEELKKSIEAKEAEIAELAIEEPVEVTKPIAAKAKPVAAKPKAKVKK